MFVLNVHSIGLYQVSIDLSGVELKCRQIVFVLLPDYFVLIALLILVIAGVSAFVYFISILRFGCTDLQCQTLLAPTVLRLTLTFRHDQLVDYVQILIGTLLDLAL